MSRKREKNMGMGIETFEDQRGSLWDETSEVRGPPAIEAALELGKKLETIIPDTGEEFCLDHLDLDKVFDPVIQQHYGPNDRDAVLGYLRLEALRIAAERGHDYRVCCGDYSRPVRLVSDTEIKYHPERRALVAGEYIQIPYQLENLLKDTRLQENGGYCPDCIAAYKRRRQSLDRDTPLPETLKDGA